jgi:hypothetical protein
MDIGACLVQGKINSAKVIGLVSLIGKYEIQNSPKDETLHQLDARSGKLHK